VKAAFYVTAIDVDEIVMGFLVVEDIAFAAVDVDADVVSSTTMMNCVAAKVEAVNYYSAYVAVDTIDNNNQHMRTVAHNAAMMTLNNHLETLSNNNKVLSDVRRHCDVCNVTIVDRHISAVDVVHIPMSFDAKNRVVRVNVSRADAFYVADIRKMARHCCNNVAEWASNISRVIDLIQSSVALIDCNIYEVH
jgi:hypothetical protein